MPDGSSDSQSPAPEHPPEQWARINRLFHLALEQPDAASRRGWVIARTADDAVVRREVLRLLEAHETAGSFLERSHEAPVAHPAPQQDPDHHPGSRIGRFRLLRLIARGGMGEVWLAVRCNAPFRQQVAVKILQQAWSDPRGQRLFTTEQQMLARLEHPGITRLIDGGTTADGRPYLVMEFVEGRPITQHCDDSRLTIRQRLELFIQACEAVHYAHQKMVLHRDLKPSNILVGADGRPRLLDFGIATLLEADAARGAQASSPAVSPAYASPEQLRGQPCTTAGDVYSLGLILQELLCGRSPQPRGGVITRLAREAEPRPCIRPQELQAAEPIAMVRRTSVTRLHRIMRGDLSAIVTRALAAEPEQRYGSVIELLDDIRCYLNRLPVSARAPTWTYKTRRFAQRNRIMLLSTALVMAALLAGLGTSWAGWVQAQSERLTATATTEFLESVFGSMSPYAAGSDPSVLDLLAAASDRATTDLVASPEVELRVRKVLAGTYASLWKWDLAHPEASRAVVLAERLTGPDSLTTADCLTVFGRAQTWRCEASSVDTQRRALGNRIARLGPSHRAVAQSKICLAFALWKRGYPRDHTEARRCYAEGIDTYRMLGETHSHDYARALFSFAGFRIAWEERSPEILELLRETVEVFEALPEQPDRYTANAVFAYGDHLTHAGRNDEGAAHLQRFLDMAPPELFNTWEVIVARYRLGEISLLNGDIQNAGALFREALVGQAARRRESCRHVLPWDPEPGSIARITDAPGFVDHCQRLLESMSHAPCREDWRLLELMASAAATMTAAEIAQPVDRLFDAILEVLGERFPEHRRLHGVITLCRADLASRRDRPADAARLLGNVEDLETDHGTPADLHVQRARRLRQVCSSAPFKHPTDPLE